MVRNSLRYTQRLDWKQVAGELKEVYTAPSLEAAEFAFELFAERWKPRYPALIGLWRNSWTEFIPFLDYPPEVRQLIYTTNGIESLSARFRATVRRRGHFPDEQSALKVLYLTIQHREKNRPNPTGPIDNWTQILNTMTLTFGDRLGLNLARCQTRTSGHTPGVIRNGGGAGMACEILPIVGTPTFRRFGDELGEAGVAEWISAIAAVFAGAAWIAAWRARTDSGRSADASEVSAKAAADTAQIASAEAARRVERRDVDWALVEQPDSSRSRLEYRNIGVTAAHNVEAALVIGGIRVELKRGTILPDHTFRHDARDRGQEGRDSWDSTRTPAGPSAHRT